MNTITLSFTRYVLVGVISFCMLLTPFFVQANNNDKADRSQGVRSEIYAERHAFMQERQKERLCRVFSEHTPLSIPAFCDDEPEPEPEAPTLSLAAALETVVAGGSTTLVWESEHADACVAEDGWAGAKATDGAEVVVVDATTTYTLTCTGAGGEVSKSVIVSTTVSEEPTDAPTVVITADPSVVLPGGTTTISWESENANSCEASEAWSGVKATSGSEVVMLSDTTSTYSIECSGPGGVADDSVIVIVEESDTEPEPTVGYPLINEVMYDLANDGSQGSEVGGANEWVELYNGTDATFDLANWEIGDGLSNDVISLTELLLGPNEYLVITNATTTANFWDFEGVQVVYLGSSISGGLANTGDSVKLYDANGVLVDAMSYGSNVSAFDPSVPLSADGSSLARASLSLDTDTAADWFEDESPTPGY